MHIAIGTRVECVDGSCGVVSRLVVDPVKRALTHLVVEPPHRRGLARLVPVELARPSGDALGLRCRLTDWEKLPLVEETAFLPYPIGVLGYDAGDLLAWPYFALEEPDLPVGCDRLPPGEIELARGDPVHARDGAIGRIEGLAVEPGDHRITHVLLQEGHLWGKKQVAIPVSALERADADGLHVQLTRREVGDLPAVAVRRGAG